MAAIPVVAPTIVRCSLHHNLGNGRHADCIVDLSTEGVGGSSRPTVVAQVAIELGKAWQRNIAQAFPGAISYSGGSYIDLDSLDGFGGTFGVDGSLPVNSGSASTILPPQNAVLIHKNCIHDRAQRSGRMYLPGVPESAVDNFGILQAAYAIGWQTQLDAFAADINGTAALVPSVDTHWRVVHVEGHEAPVPPATTGRPNAWSSSDVTTTFVDARVATQRRRNRG